MNSAELRKKKIGLALGGGGARGLAHVGVLEVLEKERIPIDIIAGTSFGAAVGALYAQGKTIRQMKELAPHLRWRKLASLTDLTVPKTGLIKGKKITYLLALSFGGDIQFSELKIPFACVATDIETGEEVVINHGSVPEAIRASISVPAVFTPVKWEGKYLVDGGLSNPVPVSVAKHMGADIIIASSVIPDVNSWLPRANEGDNEDSREPNIFYVIMQSIHITTYSAVKASLEQADVIIEPRLAHIGAGDFHRARELIQQGRLAAQSALPEIKKILKNL